MKKPEANTPSLSDYKCKGTKNNSDLSNTSFAFIIAVLVLIETLLML